MFQCMSVRCLHNVAQVNAGNLRSGTPFSMTQPPMYFIMPSLQDPITYHSYLWRSSLFRRAVKINVDIAAMQRHRGTLLMSDLDVFWLCFFLKI